MPVWNQISVRAPRHRRDVVSSFICRWCGPRHRSDVVRVAASARWRLGDGDDGARRRRPAAAARRPRPRHRGHRRGMCQTHDGRRAARRVGLQLHAQPACRSRRAPLGDGAIFAEVTFFDKASCAAKAVTASEFSASSPPFGLEPFEL